jgi:hypothetical protein
MLKRSSAVVLIGALAACGAGSPKAQRSVSPPLTVRVSQGPTYVDKRVLADIDMTVTGDETLTLENKRMAMVIVEQFGTIDTPQGPKEIPSATRFFSISAGENIAIDSGHFLFDADLAPGSYNGAPGTYEISDKGVPPIKGRSNAIGGAAYVWFLHPKPQPLVKFDVLSEPCMLKIEERALDGSLDCPKLSSFDGKTVAVHWTWKLV